MTFEAELRKRLRRATDSLAVSVPPVRAAVLRGRWRLVQRGFGLALSTLLVLGGMAWGVSALVGLLDGRAERQTAEGFDPNDVHRLPVPYGGQGFVLLPIDWQATSSAPGEHAVLGLAASTSQRAVSDLVSGSPTTGRYGFHLIRPETLGRGDAFVEVDITYMVCLSCEVVPGLPRELSVKDFSVSGVLLGQAVYGVRGIGSDDGDYSIQYWIGPNASPRTREETLFLLRHLNLPTS